MEIKDYNVVIDRKNFSDQSIKNDLKTYDNIRRIATGRCDNYTTGSLLDYIYFKNYYKLIAIDLSKQQKLDADPKAMQQIHFTGNLIRAEGTRMFFIIEEAKETVLDFSKGTVKVLWFYIILIKYLYKMTQYNTLNVKLSNWQLDKFKSGTKNGTTVTLNLSSNLIGNSNNETNFLRKFLLTYTQVSEIRKAFGNGSSANIKFLKTQLSKMIQSGGIIGGLIAATPKVMFLTGKEVLKKGISLVPKLALKLAGKATEYYIKKGINELTKKFTSSKRSGITLTNNEVKDIMEVIKALENRRIFLKGTTRRITSQEGGFLNFLRPLMTASLPLMKRLLTPLAKSLLTPLGLSAGMSAADAAIQKKIFGTGTTALIISNEEIGDDENS